MGHAGNMLTTTTDSDYLSSATLPFHYFSKRYKNAQEQIARKEKCNLCMLKQGLPELCVSKRLIFWENMSTNPVASLG